MDYYFVKGWMATHTQSSSMASVLLLAGWLSVTEEEYNAVKAIGSVGSTGDR